MDDYTQGAEFSTETTETYETSGVETTGAADQNYTEQETETTTETGEDGADAGQEDGGEQQPTADSKVETAFAKRLSAEREKIQRETYQQAQQQIMQELSPLLKLAQTEASRYGMDPLQWAQAVEASREQQFKQQLTKYAEEQGLNPAEVEQFVSQHPAVLQAKQQQQYLQHQQSQIESQQKFNQEAQEFFKMFPDAKAQDVPQEVWQMREQRGLTLLDAYLRVNHKRMLEETKVKAEQEAIKKLSKNATASPGSLSGPGSDHKFNVNDMSKQDFEAMIARVKRGEKVTF